MNPCESSTGGNSSLHAKDGTKSGLIAKFMTSFIYEPKGSRIWRMRFHQRSGDRKLLDISLGVSDKQVAEKKQAEFVREMEHEHAGLLLPKTVREAAKPKLSEQLQDFLGDLRRRGKSEEYLANLEFRVGKLLADCGWVYAKNVTADSFQAWLRTHRELKDKTANDYFEATGCFFNWMIKFGRAICNPLLAVEKAKTKDGRAIDIRALAMMKCCAY
jgi:hypothetical protein